MVTITQALTTVIWYGTGIQLSNAPWKASSLVVRQVNGSGYSSFDPNPAQASFNSLQSVATGGVLIVESLAAAYSGAGYQLDNGTAPTPAANPVRLYAAFPAGGTSVVPVTLTQGDQPGSYLVDAATPGTGISNLSYVKNGVAVTVSTSTALVLAAGDVLVITGTTAAGASGLLALLKQ